MPRPRSSDVTVGVVFAVALGILAVAVMAVGQESRLFGAKVRYRVVFVSAEGLAVGSPVQMAGVRVGVVSGIRLPVDPGERGIEVELAIDRAYTQRVRGDSRAGLRVLQYLTGEKSVEVSPGSPGTPELAAGALIEPQQDTQLFEQVGLASQNLTEVTASLKNILVRLERGEGLLGQMITNPDFGKEGLDAIYGAFTNVRALTDDLRQGKGAVGRMLQDERFAARLDSVAVAAERGAAILERIDPEHGALGELLRDDGAGRAAITDLRAAAADLRTLAERLARDDGLLGRLMSDPEYSRAMAEDLRATLAHAASITGKIDRGQGTLGALVNEREIHDGLEDVVAGANDSKFARWLLRHYQKKGIEQQPAAGEAPRAPAAEEEHP